MDEDDPKTDEYLHWSADQLAELIATREKCREIVERKATTAVAFALAVAGFAATIITEIGVLSSLGVVALLFACLYAAQAAWAKPTDAVDAEVYQRAAERVGSDPSRYHRVLRHYELVAVSLATDVDAKGKFARNAQFAALVSAVFLILAVVQSRRSPTGQDSATATRSISGQ